MKASRFFATAAQTAIVLSAQAIAPIPPPGDGVPLSDWYWANNGRHMAATR